MTLQEVLAARPSPGQPRAYDFPSFERTVLPSGLQVLAVHVPGRPLVSANLVVRRGAVDEPADVAGATILAARAMTEGTQRYPGVELIEAAERLGATLHVDASWDAFMVSVDVAATRLGSALELLAELAERPTFPESDVARLRDERLNDLLQVKADPRRRVEHAFAATIYTPESPYARPAGGDEASVPGLTPEVLRGVHGSLLNPRQAAIVIGGDLAGLDVAHMVEMVLGSFGGSPAAAGTRTGAGAPAGDAAGAPTPRADSAVDHPIVRFYHRPGAVQTELRIGHVGLRRRVPDFHAVLVMAAILGGLFNSRLQMNLREEKGYTYGVGAGFDMRRGAGPFSVRTAVQTAATVPAIAESLSELRRIRETRVTPAELAAARDYLVGVFPLRFETPGAVVGTLGGLFIHELPDDELARYRQAIEAVTIEGVQKAAQDHIDPARLAIVAVGDAVAVGTELQVAGFGEIEVIAEEMPAEAGEGDEVAE
ncbi:MAG: pitrilysin family protein [Candidatus Limnocylindrales bacterium]|jgi:zinc protease